jgi:hypothetical protein
MKMKTMSAVAVVLEKVVDETAVIVVGIAACTFLERKQFIDGTIATVP